MALEKRVDILTRFRKLCSFSLIVMLCMMDACTSSNEKTYVTGDELQMNFINPPDEAKPKTWMHAMSGNMSKEGITKDLEAMKRVGIGGLLLFNITQGIPNGPIEYNSEEHHEMLKHAAIESERLGLTFGVHNCDGWSASGGPWITPEESMKMIVWTDKIVEGGKSVEIDLPQPTTREDFYRDISVLAYPALPSELDDELNAPLVTSSDQNFDISIISDGKKDDVTTLNTLNNQGGWIQYTYQKPKTIRSINMVFNDRHSTGTLQISNDGKVFNDVKELYKVRTGKGEWAINDHFSGITAKYFRIKTNQRTTFKEIELSSTYYIQNIVGRTSIARTEANALVDIGSPALNMIVDQSKVIDLSNLVEEPGKVIADLPDGVWNIIRFGYTSTGAFNNPASDAGRGLEVDKLSRSAFKKHYDSFLKKFVINSKGVAPNALQFAEIDSYEMGGQNWTEGFKELFQQEYGYDIQTFLPLIAGRFMESSEASEKVLYDYREHICNLMTDNYFKYFTELCNEDGLKSYIEPYGFGPLNDLDIGGYTDIPMGEFWMNRDITMVASAVHSAHIYGKPVISAESFTSNPTINWKGNPRMAKNSGDLAWVEGINEFMFHRFAHQANVHAEPGMTMNRWGFHFDRTQTWWEDAGKAWFQYMARGSYLLRQGVPVSDLMVFIGDGSPNSSLRRDQTNPIVPLWINLDGVNADVLINRTTTKNGFIVLPEGTTYKMLLLQNSHKMKLATLQRLVELTKAGVYIMGDQPEELLGYNHSEEDKKLFERLANELKNSMNNEGNWEKIYANKNWNPDLIDIKMEGVRYAHRSINETDVYFFYNEDSIAQTLDLEFNIINKIPELWNPMDGKIKKSAVFTNEGDVTRTAIYLEAQEAVFVVFRNSSRGVKTTVNPQNEIAFNQIDFLLNEDLELTAEINENNDFKFLLGSGQAKNITMHDLPNDTDISNDWTVSFGEKTTKEFKTLTDWKDHESEEVKYFSGTAKYSKTVNIPVSHIENGLSCILDLGTVEVAGEVIVNEKEVGVSWMPPYRIDISNEIKPGQNTIELNLTNLWPNALIGDERFPANDGGYELGPHRATDLTMPEWYTKNKPRPDGERKFFTTAPFYTEDDALISSGLLGPVVLKWSKEIKIE